jgi:hypothetical protein
VSKVAAMVDEGLFIALSAVRMAVKNEMIIGVLREHTDYDSGAYADVARNELAVLIRQNDSYARRVRRLRKTLKRSRWTTDLTEDQRADISQLRLRRRVHEKLSLALRAVSEDDRHVARLVERAQRAASDEIRAAVSAKLVRLAIDGRDPEYEDRRAARTEVFVSIDLAVLRLRHAEKTGSADSDY